MFTYRERKIVNQHELILQLKYLNYSHMECVAENVQASNLNRKYLFCHR